MFSPIDEIKNRLNIVDVIGSYIKLKKAGANYKALCPFHSEKNPSLFVSPTRQIWHCFGCNRGGSIFQFIMEIEGVEFGDALRILAQRAGVELKPISKELKTERAHLYEICELATKFFETQLEKSSVGSQAKEYLLKRGISDESIKKWRIGYAPSAWSSLTDFLISKGYKKEEVEKAGLTIKNEKGNFYDRFRGRIIFPIFDLNSQVIGFGGRVFKSESEAKYINTPNTLLYDKSKVLYGLNEAKVEIRKKDFCILVEGYTDVILSHQAGIKNVVSTSGTALTPYQLSLLKRYSQNLIFSFDMDVGGDFATKRGIDLAQLEGFNIKVTILPKEKDPADIISQNPKEWEKIIEKAKPIIDFYFETAFSQRDPKTLEGKKEISKILLPVLKRIPNQIEKSFWVSELAKKLEVREKDIEEELQKITLETKIPEPQIQSQTLPKTRKELLEEIFLSLILKKPENIDLLKDNQIQYFSKKGQEILLAIKEKKDFKSLSAETFDFYNFLSLKAEIEEIEEEKILPEIKFCLNEIQSIEIKNQLDKISKEIKKAEEEKNLKKVEELTKKFNQIAKTLLS
jgi:DNA primase